MSKLLLTVLNINPYFGSEAREILKTPASLEPSLCSPLADHGDQREWRSLDALSQVGQAAFGGLGTGHGRIRSRALTDT